MTDSRHPIPPLSGDLPPCQIRVDREGRLWHLGAEMTHPGINSLLMAHVELDEAGRYIIEMNGQRCWVEVEDTFFVISRVDQIDGNLPGYKISLNDGNEEILDASTLRQSAENVLYATVKDGRFPARFTRPGYYQLAGYVVERDGLYYLPVGAEEYRLPIEGDEPS